MARTVRAKEQLLMNRLMKGLIKSGILDGDLDYHLIRASMVIIFLFFGYQKWFNGPFIFWLYPVFGICPMAGAPSAGGFPAMVGNVPFLMKDVVLFAASVYPLKQDLTRVLLVARRI
jgi:uncharacterized membrane protein YkgB